MNRYGLLTLSRMNICGLPAVETPKVCVVPETVCVIGVQPKGERSALHSAP